LLQVELEVLDVREPDLFQAPGAAAAVLEVHLLERFGRDLLELLVGGTGLLGIEETGGIAGRQGDRQVPDAVLVRCPVSRTRPGS
jgi:rhodanese-related sulfurtransferase